MAEGVAYEGLRHNHLEKVRDAISKIQEKDKQIDKYNKKHSLTGMDEIAKNYNLPFLKDYLKKLQGMAESKGGGRRKTKRSKSMRKKKSTKKRRTKRNKRSKRKSRRRR